MNIFLTIPTYGIHGGTRVILEWANRLSVNHDVYLYNLQRNQRCDWFDISPKVRQVISDQYLRRCDVVISTSPHSLDYLRKPVGAKKKFLFCQMAEHLFQPENYRWQKQCREWYSAPFPMLSISKWNIDLFQSEFGRKHATHYIGNGVNLEHFPLSTKPKDGKTVLVEGWGNTNPAKDPQLISCKVARRLKEDGYKIIAFSQQPLTRFEEVPNEFHYRPPLQLMNELYERATIMVKATVYDARSCAPVEAMTKGTVTARAINYGDDDLIHGQNSLRCEYNEGQLYENAIKLLRDQQFRETLSKSCIDHVSEYTWDYWMDKVNDIIK